MVRLVTFLEPYPKKPIAFLAQRRNFIGKKTVGLIFLYLTCNIMVTYAAGLEDVILRDMLSMAGMRVLTKYCSKIIVWYLLR